MTNKDIYKTKKCKILGDDYSVSVMPLDSDRAGESSDTHRTIIIADGFPKKSQTEIFYHEIAHQFLRLTGLAHMFNEETEEALAQSIGYCMYRFIQENKNLPK